MAQNFPAVVSPSCANFDNLTMTLKQCLSYENVDVPCYIPVSRVFLYKVISCLMDWELRESHVTSSYETLRSKKFFAKESVLPTISMDKYHY